MIQRDQAPAPEREGRADAERFVLARELLDVSEYDVFRRAYLDWYGREPDPRVIDSLFGAYLRTDELPMFVRHFARRYVEDHADRVHAVVDRERRAWRMDRIMLALIAALVVAALAWRTWR
jgi:hypothetical protein